MPLWCRGQPVADPNGTTGTIFTSVVPVFAIRTVRASHRLAPTALIELARDYEVIKA